MAAKLRSTLRQIPWSLASKATGLAFLWLFAPAWLFVVAALAAYFVPLFQPSRLALPALVALGLAVLIPQSAWAAALIGVLTFTILGAKDLILIDRPAAYETSVLILVFLAVVDFFRRFTTLERPAVALGALGLATVVFLLLDRMGEYIAAADEVVRVRSSRRRRVLTWGVVALALWQMSLAALALPLGNFTQAALVFAAAAIAASIGLDYLGARLDRPRIIAHAGVFAAAAAAILLTNQWGL